jgi:hypothetical protein
MFLQTSNWYSPTVRCQICQRQPWSFDALLVVMILSLIVLDIMSALRTEVALDLLGMIISWRLNLTVD